MPRITVIYRRDELYEQVWAKPMRELAKEHGISDVALAKICKKLDIPRPGRGYWARKAAGKRVKQTALPPLSPGKSPEHRVSRWKDPLANQEVGDEAQSLLAREADPSMAITVPAELQNPHKWIRKSAGNLRKHSKHPEKALLKRACLDVRTSRATHDRALLVADTLLKALDERGLRIEVTEPIAERDGRYGGDSSAKPSKTGVHILESYIEFSIEEGFDITKVEPKPSRWQTSHDSDSWTYTPRPEYKHDPNGKLALKINSYFPGQTRKTWSDGKRQRIENCLNALVLELIRGAERKRLEQIVSDRREKEWKEEQLRRQEEAKRRELEMAKLFDLDSRVTDWNHATSILEFTKSVEASAISRGEDTSPQTELGLWLAWARGHAIQLQKVAVDSVLVIRPVLNQSQPIDGLRLNHV